MFLISYIKKQRAWNLTAPISSISPVIIIIIIIIRSLTFIAGRLFNLPCLLQLEE